MCGRLSFLCASQLSIEWIWNTTLRVGRKRTPSNIIIGWCNAQDPVSSGRIIGECGLRFSITSVAERDRVWVDLSGTSCFLSEWLSNISPISIAYDVTTFGHRCITCGYLEIRSEFRPAVWFKQQPENHRQQQTPNTRHHSYLLSVSFVDVVGHSAAAN